MEQFRRNRSQSARVPSPSKVTTIVNRSSDDKLIPCHEAHRGSNHTAGQKFPKLESESRSSNHDKIRDKHRTVSELGQRTWKLPAGTPMKTYMADEMSKGTKCTRRAPSVVAKLMGLDGMPSQYCPNKQPKRSPDGFHLKTNSAGSFRHRKACNSQSCRKIAREQRQFKDVYEVRECSRNRTACCKSQVHPNMIHAEDDMAIITQKFLDAKLLPTDEKLHDLKEFHGEIEVSDSNNHLFLKFLKEPDSLLAKHLHNLHNSQESLCGRVRNLKVSNNLNNNFSEIRRVEDIEASKKSHISVSRECQMGLHHHISRNRAKASEKSANFRAETNRLASCLPTNIVLLKPNLEGSRKSPKLSSSSSSSCDDGGTRKNAGRRQAELWGKKMLPIPFDISAHKSRESEEIAKEITQQMRNKLGEISFNVPLSEYRGFSADESSQVSGGSSYESYSTCLTSHTLGRPSFHRKSSASRSAESSVNKEGKKRLSERWKVSRRSQEFRVGAKGSTLGEMLAIYDTDVRLPYLNCEITQARSLGSFNSKSKLSGYVEPLGISSRDGWRDDCISTLSTSKSLRTAYDHFGNPKTSNRHEVCGTENFLIPKEGSRNDRKNGVNSDFSWKEGSSAGITRLRNRTEKNAEVSQVQREGKKSIVEAKNLSVHESAIPESPIFRLDTILTLDSEMVREHVKFPGCLDSGDDILLAPEFFPNMQVKNNSSSNELHEITQEPPKTCHMHSLPCSQYLGAQAESRASNKEAEQPSPVSVLDAPFVEDLSSGSECFERVSAELHGLRMQLKLLKLETGASILLSSDEDEGSSDFSEGAKRSANYESWEATYMADLLSEYEFNNNIPGNFIVTWHSSECPVGPHVFEKLEKKYNNHQVASWSRSDRRLLFDQINFCIIEMARRFTDPQFWSKAWFEAELCKQLEDVKKQAEEDVVDNGMTLLQSNMEWMNLGKYIEDVGCEIEKMLLHELVYDALEI